MTGLAMVQRARWAPRAWLLAACCWTGALPGAFAQDGAAAAPADAVRPGTVPRLVVDAPGPLKDLLTKYLDLARAITLPDAATVSDAEWSRLIAATPAQARALLQPQGYFSAQAQVSREAGPPPLVRLQVDTGPVTAVSRLTFEVEGELAQRAEQGEAEALRLRQVLMAAWPLQASEVFTNKAWGDAKNSTLARLHAEGYASATWAGTGAEIDPATQGARLFVVVDSGPQYRAGPVEVEGLQHQDLDRVRALAPFQPGDALTEAQLLDYQDRLIKTGLFDQVVVSLDNDPSQAGQARVLVQLRESPRQAATLALGVSANTGPRATLEHVHRRLFGRALTVRNKFVWGRDEQSWDGELSTHPDADFRRWLLGGTVDRLLTDTDLVLSERLRLGRSKDTQGVERLAYVEGERARECSLSDGISYDCAVLNAVSLNLNYTWRRLDNAILPTSGYTLQWQGGVGLASGSATQNGGYSRLYGRATGYWPLGQSWYSQARLELGQVFTGAGVQVPDSQRFRAGGDDSVRGYPYRTLAPLKSDGSVTGGRMLFTASAEIARPVSPNLPSVWWAAFIDAGRAADRWQDMKPALGYGVGARWRSPVGPLRLDLAWGQELRKVRLHLSVGIAF